MKPPAYEINWKEVEALITEKTKMIIINSPHNPTGTVWSKSDMDQLAGLLIGRDIYVLSDEVYEHLIYDDLPHESILKYPDLFSKSAAVFSFGKTFHTTGWKMGYIIAPDLLTGEFRKIHQWNVFCVNSFLQYALAEYLKAEEHYNYLPDFYQKKRDFLRMKLRESGFRPLECKGTYFQLYDYSSISNLGDVAFAKWMTEVHGVASIPVSVFYSEPREDRLIRLCFAKNEATLEAGADRLRAI